MAASYRSIHTQIWKDNYFVDLDPNEKLLFIYLFSNELANVAGIYKISPRVIAFETGLSVDFVTDTLSKFEADGRIRYAYGILWVKNMRKYNASGSDKVAIAINYCLADIPECDIKAEYIRYYEPDIPYPYPTDTIPLKETNINESKTKVSETKNKGGGGFGTSDFAEVVRLYESNISPLTPIVSEQLGGLIDDYGAQWTTEAIKIAANNSKRSLAYIRGILSKWAANGRNGDSRPTTGKVTVEMLREALKDD